MDGDENAEEDPCAEAGGDWEWDILSVDSKNVENSSSASGDEEELELYTEYGD